MQWKELKASLLSHGSVKLTGEPAENYFAHSAAGPGAGGCGAVFFASGTHRVKLSINPVSPIEIVHYGNGAADLLFEGLRVRGNIIESGFHCPEQAFITVTGSCIFKCRYCNVPRLSRQRKSIPEIIRMVESVKDRISAISITSGVQSSVEEEESYVMDVIRKLTRFNLPIGVAIYPTEETPDRLRALGVAEVKFNLEAATPALFETMCPGLDYDILWWVLDRSVRLFGKNRVFSNVIIGLGESDEEMKACIDKLASRGVIPVLRPLNPVAEMTATPRPSAERIQKIFSLHSQALIAADLDPRKALTMCTNCCGCDLVPGRDE
jgi:biotin synthase-related radical SAM superfamily protein